MTTWSLLDAQSPNRVLVLFIWYFYGIKLGYDHELKTLSCPEPVYYEFSSTTNHTNEGAFHSAS